MKKWYMLTVNQVPVHTGTLTECERARKERKRSGRYVGKPAFRIQKVGGWRYRQKRKRAVN